MTLKEILDKCSGFEINEQRCISDEYTEIVFNAKQTDKWNEIFADILGSAVKPPGTKPTVDDLELTKEYGGVYGNQTLFKKDFEKESIMAMFWPWQDNLHTTLKLVLLNKH